MDSTARGLLWAGVSVCAFFSSGSVSGSVAPHPTNSQPTQQWVADPRTRCIAADPNFSPDDSIAWQGQCRGDGVIFGVGTLTFLNNGQVFETITGTFSDGALKPGPVTETWSDGTKYQGDQLGGLFNGAGKFVSAEGDTLDGEWKMGVLNGKASVVWANGDRYNGEWKNGKSDGEGVEIWADGRRYEGQWRDGVPVGDASVNASSAAGTGSASPSPTMATVAQPPAQAATMSPETSAMPASSVASPAPMPAAAAAAIPAAGVENGGDTAPNPAVPLRQELGAQLVAVDGATLELGLTDDGFERTLVLPNGNWQEVDFVFANGPVGTVSDGEKAIGVFRAKSDELDIDYADGATETIAEGTNGDLVNHARSGDGHAMCAAWYPQGHAFSDAEKQAAVQEYASRLGLAVSAPEKKRRAHDAGSACGGAFIASGNLQKSAGAETQRSDIQKAGAPAVLGKSQASAPEQRTAVLENGEVPVATSIVHVIDAPNASVQLEKTSLAPDQPTPASNDLHAAPSTPPPESGASSCLIVTSNGEYWGFRNNCAKAVQFAYCEMSDANPLTSCKRTSVVGSVAANGFSVLEGDRSLTEKSVDHRFRWMACDGGAGEVVPHLDRVDPPSGRCERAIAPAE